MKTNSLKLLGLALFGLIIVSCSSPAKMAKNASLVTTECQPQVLEAVAGKINATYSLNFPAKYFAQKAILDVTPVLVYQGGEIAGPVLSLQGDKILENNKVVSFEQGGVIKTNVTFDYVPGVEKAHLELRAVAYNKTKSKNYPYPAPYKVADGTNTTYMLVCTEGTPSFEADNYQKIIKEQKETQILYTINKADVRANQLSKAEIKEFEQFLKNVTKDERRTLTSNDIVAYASPDGGVELNGKLSEKRASSAKTAFIKNITKKVKAAQEAPLNISQISQDWEGFQELVSASNIQDKELILRVLSMYSDPEVREREIKNMSSVFKTLADKVLPELRRARFIANVEYKNWTDEELVQLINENIDQLDEEALLYGATLVNSAAAKQNIYAKAAEKFNSSRAYNNMAALYLKGEKTAEAKSALAKMSDKTPSYYYNMAVVALQEKNYKAAADYISKSNLKEASYNQAILDILNGKYTEAVAKLAGTGAENEGLAYILVNDLSKASAALKCKCAKSSYLRAIVAARQGNATEAKAQLEAASKNADLAKRAKTDIEFAKIN